jgi:hypothetical protein
MHVIHTSSLVLYVLVLSLALPLITRHTRLNMWPSEAPSASARELSLAAALHSEDLSPTVLTLTNGLTADDGDNFSVRISNVRSLRTLFI